MRAGVGEESRHRRPGDALHPEDEGPGGPRHGGGRVPRRAGRAGPRREGGRACPRPHRGPGGEDVPRPAGVAENDDESLYGLGQHQLGPDGHQGLRPRPLATQRARSSCPSSSPAAGYGILWDNTSFTRFGDLREPAPIPADRLFDATANPGGLTGSYFAGAGFEQSWSATRVDPDGSTIAVSGKERRSRNPLHPPGACRPAARPACGGRARSSSRSPATTSSRTFSNGGIRLWVDDRLVIDHWRQGWLPWKDVARVPLAKRPPRPLKVEWSKDQGMETVQLLWKTPSREPLDLALVRGRRRRRLLLRVRPASSTT